jgi:hypothetical protein
MAHKLGDFIPELTELASFVKDCPLAPGGHAAALPIPWVYRGFRLPACDRSVSTKIRLKLKPG